LWHIMNNQPDPLPGDWASHQYDSFMIREKELNKQTQGTGSALQQGLQVTQFPDSSIDASSLKSGSLTGDFKVANGSIASRDYSKLGTGWSINSDGTTDGFGGGANYINFIIKQSNAKIVVTNGLYGVAIPAGINGKALTVALGSVNACGTGTGVTTIQIRRVRSGSSVYMLSTGITISTSQYYASDGIINTSYDDLATGDMIYIDILSITSTSPYGLSVVLTFE